jgi:hypothetical protein
MEELLKRIERLELGIEKYGYDSDFRREIEKIVEEFPVRISEMDKVFDKYGIPKSKNIK